MKPKTGHKISVNKRCSWTSLCIKNILMRWCRKKTHHKLCMKKWRFNVSNFCLARIISEPRCQKYSFFHHKKLGLICWSFSLCFIFRVILQFALVYILIGSCGFRKSWDQIFSSWLNQNTLHAPKCCCIHNSLCLVYFRFASEKQINRKTLFLREQEEKLH